LGILGLGRIGLATALRLRAFGVSRVIYHGTREHPEASQVNGSFVSFDDLLRQSDILCICCCLNEQTYHMIGYEQLCKMKPTALLINTSRGGVIEQDGLVRALREGKIAAAGLDVTTPEPLPPTHPLANLPNCIVLPHIGSATVETRAAMSKLAVENLVAGLRGLPLPAAYGKHLGRE
jgi:glyoxylate/hydroxypyruvate reductase